MAPLNKYQPPTPLEERLWGLDTPEELYDLNFCLEVPTSLDSPGGVKLVPYVPSTHNALYDAFKAHEAMFRYLPYELGTREHWLTIIERIVRRDPATLLFAIFDQSLVFDDEVEGDATRTERMAGLVGVHKTNRDTRSTEIGHVLILPPFQRSHVNSQACSLLLQWAFDTLHLRRVQWYAHAANLPSIAAAKRLGFLYEGEMKWERIMLPSKEDGVPLPSWAEEEETLAGRGLGRHSAVLGQGWDRWREESQGIVKGLMEREVKQRRVEDLKK